MSVTVPSTYNEPAQLGEATIYTDWLSICTTSAPGSFDLYYSRKRVSDELRQMADEALDEHRAGLTEDFPIE